MFRFYTQFMLTMKNVKCPKGQKPVPIEILSAKKGRASIAGI